MFWRTAAPRYAIFYAPRPTSPLAAFGRGWLGRDPETPAGDVAERDRVRVGGLTPDQHAVWITSPRRYGLHLTLKPPFRLRPDASLEQLCTALTAFAAVYPRTMLSTLRLGIVANCLSLVPIAPGMAGQLAAACVAKFDNFRAPPAELELSARRAEGLSARQEAMLVRWGFPYVMDDARISLTLTNPLPRSDIDRLTERLTPIVAPLCRTPVPIDDVCLCAQPVGAEEFVVIGRFPLNGASVPTDSAVG